MLQGGLFARQSEFIRGGRHYLRARVFLRLRCNRRTRFFFLVLLILNIEGGEGLLPFGSHLRLFDFDDDELELGGESWLELKAVIKP
jgi:hypothetical protein